MEPGPNPEEKKIEYTDIRRYFGHLFRDFIDLSHGVDKWGTIREIKGKQAMSGANAWMLMCSIIIASVGLNLNSQAVIIGAMLISPLMSPILGIGLAVAINDRDALSHALLHFGAAILIAVGFSTLYFILTPLDAFTEQISARTAPTFLDVLIGVFGGVAGIISVARKDISTTLPGVAIATALMPPLCVVGYGLAHWSWEITSKSFYLFFLNSFFVAFATYVIVRYLKFPYKSYSSKKERRKNIAYVSLFSIVMIIPSIIIFSEVFLAARDSRRLETFINRYIGDHYIFLDDYELVTMDDDSRKLIMKVYGDSIRRSRIPYYEKGLKEVSLNNTTVEIIPTSEINLSKIRQLESQLSGMGEQINEQIRKIESERLMQDAYIREMEERNDLAKLDSTRFADITRQLKILMPEIESIVVGIGNISDFKETRKGIPVAVVSGEEIDETRKARIGEFLKTSYNLDTIIVLLN